MQSPKERVFEFESEAGIRSDFLETIDYTGNPQTITYMTEEFSAVCPSHGLPDIARVTVEFIPEEEDH
jgi:7-cyano-7-deazaguanine reductase